MNLANYNSNIILIYLLAGTLVFNIELVKRLFGEVNDDSTSRFASIVSRLVEYKSAILVNYLLILTVLFVTFLITYLPSIKSV